MAIMYPEKPPKPYKYVPITHPFMVAGWQFAMENSLDDKVKTASILVKDGLIIGRGANGSDFHKLYGCERKRRGSPTGKDYHLCPEGCGTKNHSEPKAIQAAIAAGHDPRGADLYLYGHWWACGDCWKAVLDAEVAEIYLAEGSDRFFNITLSGNVLGVWPAPSSMVT